MIRSDRRRSLSLENLEVRSLMAADMFAPLDAPATVATTSNFGGFFGDPLFDKHLTASVKANRFDATKKEIVIDGSDYEDRITIRQYTAGTTNDQVTLELSQWDGTTQISARTVTMNVAGKLPTNGFLSVHIDGKDGGDRITNQTSLKMAVSGGSGNDIIQAGSNGDTISGGRGFNHLSGGVGVDVIHGGADRDIIIGWGGDDILYGQGGDDDIYGDSTNNDSTIGIGNDTIYGGDGNDKIWGGRGTDEITAGDGNDQVWAGIGDDKVWGGAGNDTIYGEKGNDTIWGEGDLDHIFGGDGNDTLDGGNGGGVGVDYLSGGAGRDTFYRHISVIWGVGSSDGDIFADYNSVEDSINEELHW